MIKTPRRYGLLTALLLSLISAPVAFADDDDHERAHRALQQGQVKPFSEILEAVGQRFAGDVLEVEFENEDGRYVYELKIFTPDGHLREIHVDALTAEILSSEND